MLFAIFHTDKPDSTDLRATNRPAHLEYLQTFNAHIVMVGPTLSDDLKHMNGGLLIMEFTDKAEAQAFVENDPYAQTGLFESTHIRPWKKVFPQDKT